MGNIKEIIKDQKRMVEIAKAKHKALIKVGNHKDAAGYSIFIIRAVKTLNSLEALVLNDRKEKQKSAERVAAFDAKDDPFIKGCTERIESLKAIGKKYFSRQGDLKWEK